jgi:hypothetical protein
MSLRTTVAIKVNIDAAKCLMVLAGLIGYFWS